MAVILGLMSNWVKYVLRCLLIEWLDKIQIDDFTIGYKINAGKKSKKES